MSTVKVNNMKVYSGTDLAIGEASTEIKTVGNTTLGNSDSNTVTYNAKIDSAVLPDGDGTRNLGSAAARWNLYSATTTTTTITSPTSTDLTISSPQDIYMNPTNGVGIGTSAPTGTLHVSKADARVRIEATTADNNCQLDFYNGNGKYVNIGNSINTAGSLFEINEVSPTAGNVMTILTGGNVGIGTTAPSSTLHLKRTDDSAKHLTLEQTEGSGKKYHIIADDAGALAIQDDSATRIYVKSGGNVGIGTTSPSQPLHVAGNAEIDGDLTVDGNIVVNGTTSTINSTTLTVDDKNIELGSVGTPSDTTADGGGITLKGASDKTILWTNSTDKWTFNQGIDLSAGDLVARNKIAVGSNHSPEATVDIYQASSAAVNGLRVRNNSGTLRQGVTAAGVGEVFMLTSDDLSFGTNDTERARITAAGNMGIGTTDPGTMLQIQGTTPYLTLKNSTSEHGEGGCESKVIFEDHANIALAQIQASHAGTSDNSAGDLIFSTSTVADPPVLTEAMRIDESQKVGIGTSTPASKLDVEGGVTIGASYSGTNAAPTNGLIVEGNVGIGTFNPTSNLEIQTSSGDLILEMDNNDSGGSNFQIQNGAGNSRVDMVMNDGSANTTLTFKGQKVGILDTDPSYTLDVNGTGQVTSNLIVGADLTVDTSTLKVDSSNNRVGIGTANPSVQLDVHDTTTSSANTGGKIRLSANDGAAMGDSHRLGVIEFTGAEDTSNTQVIGARIEALTDGAWTNVANPAALYFYVNKGDNTAPLALKLDNNKKATFYGDAAVSGVLSLADGSASAPSLTNTGDTNCGLFFSAADTLAFTAGGTAQVTFADGLIAPVTNDDVDLGTASLRFKNIYTMDLHLANERGDWTVIEEEDYLSLRNNKNGKLFKIVMQEILEE